MSQMPWKIFHIVLSFLFSNESKEYFIEELKAMIFWFLT